MWLRLTLADTNHQPSIWPADYLTITHENKSVSGIVMRQHHEPWRIDVLCHLVPEDAAKTFLALPISTKLSIAKTLWDKPEQMQSNLLLTDDTHGLATVSMSYAWQALDITTLVLWQTQGNLPFPLAPSHIYTPELPADVIATMLDIEAMGVVLRILTSTEKPGCFHGNIDELLATCPNLNTWHIGHCD